MITLPPSSSAATLIFAARKKFCDIESLAALRRHEALVFFSLMFLGPTMFPRPRLVASPVTALVLSGESTTWFARLFPPLLYCAIVFLAFAWQREMLRGGGFRAYLSSLPLSNNALRNLDHKLIARRGWAFLLPQVVALGVMRHAFHTFEGATSVILATLFMSIVAWRLAVAAVERENVAASIAIACVVAYASAVHASTQTGFFVTAATFVAAAAAAWHAPAIAMSLRPRRLSIAKPVAPFLLRGLRVMWWLQLPLGVLWQATRSGVVTRVAASTALCTLAAVGIVWFGMHDRWRGLMITVFAITIWLFTSLYEPIDEARQKVPVWKSWPLSRAAAFASDASGVCALAVMPILLSSALLIANGFFGAAALCLGAITLLFALRGLLSVPSHWRVVVAPAVVILCAVLATFAI